MKFESLRTLFVHELKDLYNAETQILQSLPDLIEAATDEELKEALQNHLRQTRDHVSRLERIFQSLEDDPAGQRCKGMAGIIDEAKEVMKTKGESEVRDAAIVAAAQRIEHYEIAGYGTARTFAEKLGDYTAADLLQQTLNEEGLTDVRLTRLAERKINTAALTVPTP